MYEGGKVSLATPKLTWRRFKQQADANHSRCDDPPKLRAVLGTGARRRSRVLNRRRYPLSKVSHEVVDFSICRIERAPEAKKASQPYVRLARLEWPHLGSNQSALIRSQTKPVFIRTR
jgi:hypothetical protein